MKLFYTLTVGDEEYKLRLTAGAMMSIEKKLGKSFLKAMEDVDNLSIETITTVLWGAMQPFNSGFTMEKASKLFDDYIDDGNSVEDMMGVILDMLKASGFFSKGQE
jgi:hypothetical protein